MLSGDGGVQKTKELIKLLSNFKISGKNEFYLSGQKDQMEKNIKRFRIRENKKDLGKIFQASDKINIKKGKTYFFDRFTK